MSLYQQVIALWNQDVEEKTARWAQELQGAMDRVQEASSLYHDWSPLQSIISLSKARLPKLQVSLRYCGQEVGVLEFPGNAVVLKNSLVTAANTRKVFGIELPVGEFLWTGPEARNFKKTFQSMHGNTNQPSFNEKIQERHIQAMMWKQMELSSEGGFKACQPVMIGTLPFQCPVPLSCNTGIPKLSDRGNMDILARRGLGKGTFPAIWELKRPGVCEDALSQAYLYAVQLALMLRAPEQGQVWYTNLGFKGTVPQDLKIDIILALSFDRKNQLQKQIDDFQDSFELPALRTTIRPHVAWYTVEKGGTSISVETPLPLENII